MQGPRNVSFPLVAVVLTAVVLTSACQPGDADDSDATLSSERTAPTTTESTSAPEPVPVFIPVDGLDLCLSSEEMAELDSLEFDASFEYDLGFAHNFHETRGHVSDCIYSLTQNNAGDETVTSDVMSSGIRSFVIPDADSRWEVASESDLAFQPPGYFDPWTISWLEVSYEEDPWGLCFVDVDRIGDCTEEQPVMAVDLKFAAWTGNFRISFDIFLFTPDLDRDMEAWVGEVLTEVTEAIVSRVPTE